MRNLIIVEQPNRRLSVFNKKTKTFERSNIDVDGLTYYLDKNWFMTPGQTLALVGEARAFGPGRFDWVKRVYITAWKKRGQIYAQAAHEMIAEMESPYIEEERVF